MFINNPLFDGCRPMRMAGWHPSEQDVYSSLTMKRRCVNWTIEGMLQLLELLAGREQAFGRRADSLPEWQAFLHQHSKFASPSSVKQRSMPGFTIWSSELITREGMTTEAGRVVWQSAARTPNRSR